VLVLLLLQAQLQLPPLLLVLLLLHALELLLEVARQGCALQVLSVAH
jgi:hypothetical protein